MSDTRLILTTDDALRHLRFIRTKKQEYLLCLSLDSGDRLIARRTVTIGTLTSSIAHPREVFAGPLKDRAAAVIIAHNHPSGVATPSRHDIKTTNQLVAAAQILGITLRDHIVVTPKSYFSFREKGLLL
jgi:DNA repair protein RadC